MKSKILSLVMAGLMLAAALAGCSTATPTPAPTQAPATVAPTSAAPTPVPTPEYSEITIEVFDRGTDGGKTDPTNNYYTKWIQDKVKKDLNIGVSFKAVSRWEETTQLNNLMAASSAPDVCLTYDAGLVNNYRDLGGIVDLKPFVDTLLPDLKKFLGPDIALPGRDFIDRNLDTKTGKMYSIQARRMNVAELNTFIRKDWLDKLGLPLPTTTQEFVDDLKKFKEMDPGKVGKDKVIPFTMSNDVRWTAGTLLESFIDPNISDKDRWVNTVVDRAYLLPGYKEGARLMNKMFNEGLIDTEFPLYTDDTTCANLIKSGVVGAFIHNWDQPYRDTPGMLKDLLKNVPDAQIVSIDPFKNSAGKTTKPIYDEAGVYFFVPVTCKHPESALRYINWMSIFENRNYLQIGDEGATHTLVNGLPKLISATGEKIMNSASNIDYTIMINGLDLGDPDKNTKAIANGYTVDPSLIITAYGNALNNGRAPLIVPVVLSAAGPVSQTLIDKGNTLMAKAITAKPEDFDKVWDAAIADWLASGAQAVIDERASKYAEYFGK